MEAKSTEISIETKCDASVTGVILSYDNVVVSDDKDCNYIMKPQISDLIPYKTNQKIELSLNPLLIQKTLPSWFYYLNISPLFPKKLYLYYNTDFSQIEEVEVLAEKEIRIHFHFNDEAELYSLAHYEFVFVLGIVGGVLIT